MSVQRFLGIFVHPVDVQSAGLNEVFEHLTFVGANAICITPKVARLATKGKGVRFPPLHIDGYSRVLDRPIWGQRELFLEFFNCYSPDISLFARTPYKPPSGAIPFGPDAHLPEQIITEAHRRGMQAHILIQPFVLPRVSLADRPRYVDGSAPFPPQVAFYACLNSPAAKEFALASALDTVRFFCDIDGLFTDWAEYGAYRFEDHFACFCPHCERRAGELGLDWLSIQRDVGAAWRWFHSLTAEKIDYGRRVYRHPSAFLELLIYHPGWLELFKLKARTVVSFYQDLRRTLDAAGFKHVGLSARGWPPPWNHTSGMDYRALSGICDAVTPKLFTFDYSAIPRWYAETLLKWNPGLPESTVLDALVEWLNLKDDLAVRTMAHYHIPAPGEAHFAKVEIYQDRIDEVRDQIGNQARLYPFVHAYLPEPQWQQMIAMIQESRADGMWVQMYGYLSDRKLEILKDMW